MMNLVRLANGSQAFRGLLVLSDQLLISGTRFVTSWMLARFCGAEQLGYYSLGFSVLVLIDLLLQAFVTAPLTVYSQRSADHRISHYFGDTLLQACLIGALGSLIFLAAGASAAIFDSPILARTMLALAATVVLCVLREFVRRHCFATNRLGMAFVVDAVFSIVQVASLCLLLHFTLLSSVMAHVTGGIACAGSIAVWAIANSRGIRFRSKRWRLHTRRHWRFGRWVFVSQTTNQLNWNVVQWIIAFWLSAEATGVFTGCLTIAFLSNPFVLGVANVIYPRLALTLAKHGEVAMRQLAMRAVGAIALVMCTFTFVLLFAGQSICDFLYASEDYSNSAFLLASLAGAVSCLAITMPIDGCLWAKERADSSSVASGTGLVVTTLAVLLLVRWGTTASAIGLLIGCFLEASARVVLFTKLCRRVDARLNVISTNAV